MFKVLRITVFFIYVNWMPYPVNQNYESVGVKMFLLEKGLRVTAPDGTQSLPSMAILFSLVKNRQWISTLCAGMHMSSLNKECSEIWTQVITKPSYL